MKQNIIYVYCDGGCKVHTSKLGGYGIVLLYNGHKKTVAGYSENATNNQMEILAATIALQKITRYDIPVIITTDSEHVVKGINEWTKKWLTNNWKGANKKPVKNIDLWKNLLAEIKKFDNIEFIHCYGHTKVQYNEEADKLATLAMETLTNMEG